MRTNFWTLNETGGKTKVPKVAVITAVYKKEDSIDECVKSVLSQNYQDYEYILVDDESPDKCPQICDAYAKLDNRIKVIHQKNGGHALAVNSGINFANSTYITILDADDYFCDPEAIKEMVVIAEKNNSDIVVTDFLNVWNKHNPPKIVNGSGIEILKYFIGNNIYHPTTRAKLIRKSLFQNGNLFKELICDDEEWTPKAFFRAKIVSIMPKAIYCRTTPVDSVTRIATEENFVKKATDRAVTSGILIDFFEKQKICEETKKILYERFIALYVSSLFIVANVLKSDQYKQKAMVILKENKFVLNYAFCYSKFSHGIIAFISKIFGLKSIIFVMQLIKLFARGLQCIKNKFG